MKHMRHNYVHLPDPVQKQVSGWNTQTKATNTCLPCVVVKFTVKRRGQQVTDFTFPRNKIWFKSWGSMRGTPSTASAKLSWYLTLVRWETGFTSKSQKVMGEKSPSYNTIQSDLCPKESGYYASALWCSYHSPAVGDGPWLAGNAQWDANRNGRNVCRIAAETVDVSSLIHVDIQLLCA